MYAGITVFKRILRTIFILKFKYIALTRPTSYWSLFFKKEKFMTGLEIRHILIFSSICVWKLCKGAYIPVSALQLELSKEMQFSAESD